MMKSRLLSAAYTILSTAMLLQAGNPTHAATIFTDDFTDGNTDGWSFYGQDDGEWGVLSGALNSSVSADDTHDGMTGFALIDGITTPDHFLFEADISVINTQGVASPGDTGHVGFVWGVQNPGGTGAIYNTSYLRTHLDHVTNWRTDGSGDFLGPEQIFNVGSVTNSITYHMSIEVDYLASSMTTIFTNGATIFSETYSGVQFNNGSNWSGGSIGLIQWGEEVSYDNVVLQELSAVPLPAAVWLFGSGLLGLVGMARRKKA